MKSVAERNVRPPHDEEILGIADYVASFELDRPEAAEAYDTARLCLMDSLGCAFLALGVPECARHLGPIVPGTVVPDGARVPGTAHVLDPVKAAWDIGCTIRWLDFNDTWLAAEWGHPSDNLGAILAAADWLGRSGKNRLTVRDLLTAMICAYEIQGCLALENAFNRVGLDHVLLVRVASAAVGAGLLALDRDRIADTVSHAWIDGSSLRVYRQAPNTGPRKSWAAGDASSRGLFLAMLVERGEIGYPSALTAPGWGFYDTSFRGERFRFQRSYGSYVMENILFKVSYPAEFHAQTAVEAAVRLRSQIVPRLLDDIERIEIRTHESAIRIIDKTGPLDNPADRDHCLQYMVAVALLRGDLTAEDYEDEAAADPRIDTLREKMVVEEEPRYTRGYLDPNERSIANRVQVFFSDGSSTEAVEVEYPLGHRRRRDESRPALESKFADATRGLFPDDRAAAIVELFADPERLDAMPVTELVDRLVLPGGDGGA